MVSSTQLVGIGPELRAMYQRLGFSSLVAEDLAERAVDVILNRTYDVYGKRPADTPHLFALNRKVDETGVSGTGYVAYGVQFADGTCALRWNTETTSTGVYSSIEHVETIHGHGGLTEIVWL